MSTASDLLAQAMAATNIGRIIGDGLILAGIRPAEFARKIDKSPQWLCDMIAGRKGWQDDLTRYLPDTCRQEVAKIRIRQILAQADQVRRDAGLSKDLDYSFVGVTSETYSPKIEAPPQEGDRLGNDRSDIASAQAPDPVFLPACRFGGGIEPEPITPEAGNTSSESGVEGHAPVLTTGDAAQCTRNGSDAGAKGDETAQSADIKPGLSETISSSMPEILTGSRILRSTAAKPLIVLPVRKPPAEPVRFLTAAEHNARAKAIQEERRAAKRADREARKAGVSA